MRLRSGLDSSTAPPGHRKRASKGPKKLKTCPKVVENETIKTRSKVVKKKVITQNGLGKRKSPYFLIEKKPRENVSCIPFPPLDQTGFGLAQERLQGEPFHLLLACIFLNKTRGAVAMPVFYRMIDEYPSAPSIADARHEDLVKYFQNLGLQHQRAKKVKALARMWCCRPPTRGRRYRCLHYPRPGDGKELRKDQCIDDDDPRVAWEVAHLPGVGAYAYDSWRIFCRDRLRGLSADTPELDQEWTRVVPLDKELRAYLRWRWLQLGWVWNPVDGHRRKALPQELETAQAGGVIIEPL